jgi:hypothetical protein
VSSHAGSNRISKPLAFGFSDLMYPNSTTSRGEPTPLFAVADTVTVRVTVFVLPHPATRSDKSAQERMMRIAS